MDKLKINNFFTKESKTKIKNQKNKDRSWNINNKKDKPVILRGGKRKEKKKSINDKLPHFHWHASHCEEEDSRTLHSGSEFYAK
jgi:hypothetical protein